jgi:hypothetical protein
LTDLLKAKLQCDCCAAAAATAAAAELKTKGPSTT